MVGAVHDFNALELLPEVREAYAEDLVDDSVIGLADIDPDARRQPRGYAPPSPEQRYQWFCERNAPIDAVNECSAWRCFRDEDDVGEPSNADADDPSRPKAGFGLAPDESPKPTPAKPYIAPPKVGRNEPCPCGSGRKYEKCCGN